MRSSSRRRRELASRDWDELAELDPFWAILGSRARDADFDLEAFFASGEVELSRVLISAEALEATATFGRALDFGSGLGRLVRAMSARFDECVGIDVSPCMVERARELNADRANCTFSVGRGPAIEYEPRSFDFVYSRLVLQHLSRSSALRAVAELVRVAKPDGLVVFQLPWHLPLRNRLQPRRRLWHTLRALGLPPRFLRERLLLHPVSLIAVPESAVRAVVETAGARIALSEPDDEAAPPSRSYRYFVRPRLPG
jgi:SAM-dependent methyltransferase